MRRDPILHDKATAREAIEALRWPNDPVCPRCSANGNAVMKVGGTRHREGLYVCRPCRTAHNPRPQFTVTIDTPFERGRVSLTAWLRVLHAFSACGTGAPTTLLEVQRLTDVSYPTAIRMKKLVQSACERYRGGRRVDFGDFVQSWIRQPGKADKAVAASNVLTRFSDAPRAHLARTERLIRVMLEHSQPIDRTKAAQRRWKRTVRKAISSDAMKEQAQT